VETISNKLFTKEEVKILSENKYVNNVSTKGITYTDEFKKDDSCSIQKSSS